MIKIVFFPYNNNGQIVDTNKAEAATYTGRSNSSPQLEKRVSLRRSWANFDQIHHPVERYLALFSEQGRMLWRSGKTTLSQASNMYVLIKETIEITEAEMQNMLPELPMKQGDATISSMKLDLKKGKVAVSGSGKYDAWIDLDYDFTYSFKLNPYQDLKNTKRIISVNTVDGVDVKVKGFFGGLFSFIANFMEDGFTSDVETTLQAEIDKAVDAQIVDLIDERLDGQRPEGVTVTVQSAKITPEKIIVEVIAGVPGSAISCGSQLQNRGTKEQAEVGVRSLTEVNSLRSLRDQVLDPTENGRAYRALYEAHQQEIFDILINQPEILIESDAAIKGMFKDFRDGDGKLSATTAKTVESLLERMKPHASDDLSEAIGKIQAEIPRFIDQNPQELL